MTIHHDFEYKEVKTVTKGQNLLDWLEEYHSEGWILVSHSQTSDNHSRMSYIFRKDNSYV